MLQWRHLPVCVYMIMPNDFNVAPLSMILFMDIGATEGNTTIIIICFYRYVCYIPTLLQALFYIVSYRISHLCHR